MKPRWAHDEGSGGVPLPGQHEERVRRFASSLRDAHWLTEDPEEHLGPKVDAWLAARSDWPPIDRATLPDGTWLLSGALPASLRGRSARERRAAAVGLAGSFAEDILFVEQLAPATDTFVVLTGQPSRDGVRAHGHVIRLQLV